MKTTIKQQRALSAIEALKVRYPQAVCSLNSETPFQLLVATRLSAQCTDERVNKVTPALFKALPDAQAFSKAPIEEIENYIKSCGLYKTKARDLQKLGAVITEQYGGKIPDTIEELVKLPGVGRKTANLICGDVFGKPAIVTDTHCIRICGRLGLTTTKDPKKTEDELRKLLPPEESNAFCHRIVLYGREVCTARKPKCGECELKEFCPKKGVENGESK